MTNVITAICVTVVIYTSFFLVVVPLLGAYPSCALICSMSFFANEVYREDHPIEQFDNTLCGHLMDILNVIINFLQAMYFMPFWLARRFYPHIKKRFDYSELWLDIGLKRHKPVVTLEPSHGETGFYWERVSPETP